MNVASRYPQHIPFHYICTNHLSQNDFKDLQFDSIWKTTQDVSKTLSFSLCSAPLTFSPSSSFPPLYNLLKPLSVYLFPSHFQYFSVTLWTLFCLLLTLPWTLLLDHSGMPMKQSTGLRSTKEDSRNLFIKIKQTDLGFGNNQSCYVYLNTANAWNSRKIIFLQ